MAEVLNEKYPGVSLEEVDQGMWRLNIPQRYREGHEAHFARVTERFLEYMAGGRLPEWEVTQMLAKYIHDDQGGGAGGVGFTAGLGSVE
jgi:hypothetical protein